MNDKQKVVLVTGSSRGIGRGIAMEMARRVTPWSFMARTTRPCCARHIEEVKRLSPASICVVAELSDSSAIREMFDVIRSTFGRLDALVNNAATQNPSPISN